MTENLWGELPEVVKVRTPKQILLEQAAQLRDMTGGKLIGEVVDQSSGANFNLTLNVVAPVLNNYSFTILTISHTIHLYPLTIKGAGKGVRCHDEEQYISALSSILKDPGVQKNIVGLLAHIGASAETEE